jgi:hypothetical protein
MRASSCFSWVKLIVVVSDLDERRLVAGLWPAAAILGGQNCCADAALRFVRRVFGHHAR